MAQQPCGIPTLFLTFLKIGAFTFGGGYAMIPLIQREVTEKRSWLAGSDILDIVAIAESTPGPIAINAATFVGYRVRGVPGAFFATLGVVVPAFLTILAVSLLLDRFQDNVYVQYAFTGIRAGILALMVRALWSMYRQCPQVRPGLCPGGAGADCRGVFLGEHPAGHCGLRHNWPGPIRISITARRVKK